MTETENPGGQGNEPKARVLIADDSKIVRVTASKILETQFDVVLAEDGEDAWQKICTDDSIQVVFTDLGMPKLDGYGLIQRIRQSENEGIRNQPVIVITGAAEDEGVRRKVFELGATDFITKPFKSTEIIARAEAHASYRRDKDSLQKNVDTDLLTGTLNHSGISKQLEKDVSFINRHNENLAVIIFELDGFGAIYERIGEQTSHKIIKEVAATLLGAIRKEDSVGRYASEKFIVILPMAKTEGVVILAKRLCERIKSFKITVGGEVLPLTMSAGIATAIKGQPASTKQMLHTADQALANAKAVGAGEVQLLKLENGRHEEPVVVISVDGLLDAISKGKTDSIQDQMDAIISRLLPLVSLMTEEQKRKLIG